MKRNRIIEWVTSRVITVGNNDAYTVHLILDAITYVNDSYARLTREEAESCTAILKKAKEEFERFWKENTVIRDRFSRLYKVTNQLLIGRSRYNLNHNGSNKV